MVFAGGSCDDRDHDQEFNKGKIQFLFHDIPECRSGRTGMETQSAVRLKFNFFRGKV